MSEKILVIDDEETTVQLIAILLERRKYEVIKGYSAEEGLRLAYRNQPDLGAARHHDAGHGWLGSVQTPTRNVRRPPLFS